MNVKTKTKYQISRRGVIFAAMAYPLVSLPKVTYASELTAQDMVRLSAMLTQKPFNLFFPETAATLLKIYQQRKLTERLKALLIKPDSDPELSQEIVATWYSGVAQTIQGRVVLTYNNALMWQTATFLKPSGRCGGMTNYWSLPPNA